MSFLRKQMNITLDKFLYCAFITAITFFVCFSTLEPRDRHFVTIVETWFMCSILVTLVLSQLERLLEKFQNRKRND